MKKVLIVDDHALFRSGLKLILCKNPDIAVAGQADCGRAAVEAVRSMRGCLDLVILDINLPDIDGIEVARQIKQIDDGVKVLMLTMYDDPAFLKASLEVGADGYVIKQAVDEELAAAVNAVLGGKKYVYPTMSAALIWHETGGGGERPRVTLSNREREVLRLIAFGYTQREIGDELCISEKTVETYKARLMSKLGFEKRSELVRYAFESGIAKFAR